MTKRRRSLVYAASAAVSLALVVGIAAAAPAPDGGVVDDGARDTQLKFVISNEANLTEAQALLHELDFPLPSDHILLMPEGRTMEELRAKSAWLVEVCKTHGYRFCHRLHIELFGNTRAT